MTQTLSCYDDDGNLDGMVPSQLPERYQAHDAPEIVWPEDKPSRFDLAADWLAVHGWSVVVWAVVLFAGGVLAAWILG
jgi:hypothetical protein